MIFHEDTVVKQRLLLENFTEPYIHKTYSNVGNLTE